MGGQSWGHTILGPSPRLCAGVTKSEMVLWHKQYLECCKELNQWEVVNEYAKVLL